MNNLIQVFENTISPRVCDNLIHKFEYNIDNKKGIINGKYDPEYKKTTDLTFGKNQNTHLLEIFNLLNTKLINSITKYINITNFQLSCKFTVNDFKIEKYLKNNGYCNFHNNFHYYKITDNSNNNKTIMPTILSFLFYLNTIDEEGETEFIDGTKIKPEKGKLIIFPATWSYIYKENIPLNSNKYIVSGYLLLNNL